eukprot:7753279-Pyramimonas_sp.AAC.1
MSASWGSFATPVGGLLGRFGGFEGCLEAIVGVLERYFGDSSPSWTVRETFRCPLGSFWGFLFPRDAFGGGSFRAREGGVELP